MVITIVDYYQNEMTQKANTTKYIYNTDLLVICKIPPAYKIDWHKKNMKHNSTNVVMIQAMFSEDFRNPMILINCRRFWK